MPLSLTATIRAAFQWSAPPVVTWGTGTTALTPAVIGPSLPADGLYWNVYSVITSALFWPVALAHDLAAATVQCVATCSS